MQRLPLGYLRRPMKAKFDRSNFRLSAGIAESIHLAASRAKRLALGQTASNEEQVGPARTHPDLDGPLTMRRAVVIGAARFELVRPWLLASVDRSAI